MSYSFGVRAATKADAKAAVAIEFDKVVAQQPVHAADRAAAEAVVGSFIDTLSDPSDSEDVLVSCSGSVMGRWSNGTVERVESVNVGATAYLGKKTA